MADSYFVIMVIVEFAQVTSVAEVCTRPTSHLRIVLKLLLLFRALYTFLVAYNPRNKTCVKKNPKHVS